MSNIVKKIQEFYNIISAFDELMIIFVKSNAVMSLEEVKKNEKYHEMIVQMKHINELKNSLLSQAQRIFF